MSAAPVIIITGASSGFGEAVARLFVSRGYQVAIAARRLERLEVLADAIRKSGGQALPVQTDVSHHDQVIRLVETTQKSFGRIDVLFNNAGFGRMNWLEQLDPMHDVQAQIQVNLLGMIWMAQAVLPGMIQQHSGHIINMASMASFVGTPTYTVYAACKFGVRGFTEALRREVRIHGIHVSGIYPGGAETEFNEIAGIRRTTNIKTPDFMLLDSNTVAEAVWRLVKRPRRARIMPWLLNLAAAGNLILPGIYDSAIERLFVRPERSRQ